MLSCALGLVVLAAWRSNELFRIAVRDGQLRLERGRLPPALFDEVSEILRRERVQHAVVRVVLETGRPRLFLDAEASAVAQPLRNVLGRFSLAELRSGRMRARQ